MALQFQPPNFDPNARKNQDRKERQDIVQGIPGQIMSWQQFKQQQQLAKAQHDLQLAQMNAQMRELQAKYGTGEPPPANPSTMTPTVSQVGPEEQMFGQEATMPGSLTETPEQAQARLGTERYGQLNPSPTNIIDPSGNVLGQVSGKTAVLPNPPVAPNDREDAKQQAKIKAEKPKAMGSLKNTLREYDNMITAAEGIRNDTALPQSTGLFAGHFNVTEGQRRVDANLETLKAKTLLNVLSSMKELSKTGSSGFGQLSEIEGENIRNSISSLKRSQGTKDFQASLDRFIEEMKAKKQTLKDTFESTYGGTVQDQTKGGVPSIGDMFEGHKVLSVKRIE